jgi:deoxycytidylate deaminase
MNNKFSNKIHRLLGLLRPHVSNSNMEQKHAALLISGGKPLTFGYNHNRMIYNRNFIRSYHAEIHSLSQFLQKNNLNSMKKVLSCHSPCNKYTHLISKKLEILVIRLDKQGNLKNSKPCKHCLETLKKFNIKTVYYSTDEGKIEMERIRDCSTDHYSHGQKRYYKIVKNVNL